MNTKSHSIVIVDDHVLLRNGLAGLISNFDGYHVLFEAGNGRDFIDHITRSETPDIVLLDINMPVMDGYDTAQWIKEHLPETRVLTLSMYDNDNAVIRMIKNGARGYVLKDIEPRDLKLALDAVLQKGYYYSDMVTGKLINAITRTDDEQNLQKLINLSEREIGFLKLVCTELTYKEIADQLFISPRTVDSYRDALFEKLNVKTRVGLVLYAVKNGIVNL